MFICVLLAYFLSLHGFKVDRNNILWILNKTEFVLAHTDVLECLEYLLEYFAPLSRRSSEKVGAT